MRDVNKKFSVRYFLNLVLVDEEDRRYFKQQVLNIALVVYDTLLIPASAQPTAFCTSVLVWLLYIDSLDCFL